MTAADEIRKLIAEADSEAAKADREKLPITTAFYGGAAKYLGHALEIVEREAASAPADLAAKIRALMAEAIEQGRKHWLANEWEQFGVFEHQIAALRDCLDRLEAAPPLPAPHAHKQEPAAPAKDTP